MVEPVRVLAFDAQGGPLFSLPYTSCSWSDSINEAGGLEVEVQYSTQAAAVPGGLWRVLRLWGSHLAAVRGSRVLHAGWLTSYKWDAEHARLTLTCGGGMSILRKRLVLNHELDKVWRDGAVLVDEQHPAGPWVLELKGTYRDIASGLVGEAMKWGGLPFDLPKPDTGGTHDLSYAGYDLATVSDRLEDLSHRADGHEISMDPYLDAGGRLRYRLRSEPEIVDHEYTEEGAGVLSAVAPGSRVRLTGADGDGADMTGQVYASGGKGDDMTVICRDGDGIEGLPLLQSADTEHTTATNPSTLIGHIRGDLAFGCRDDETFSLQVGEETPLRPGDHMDVQVQDLFFGWRRLRLKVTDVGGSSGSDWQDVQARAWV